MDEPVPDPRQTGEPWRWVGARVYLHATETVVPTYRNERDESLSIPPVTVTVELPSGNAMLVAHGDTIEEAFVAARCALAPIWQDVVEECEPVIMKQALEHWAKGYEPTVGSFPTWPVLESDYYWPRRPMQTFDYVDTDEL